jgi:hypothetical protein
MGWIEDLFGLPRPKVVENKIERERRVLWAMSPDKIWCKRHQFEHKRGEECPACQEKRKIDHLEAMAKIKATRLRV